MTGGMIWILMQQFQPLRTTPTPEIPMPESLRQGIRTTEIHTGESPCQGIPMAEIHTDESLHQGIPMAEIHTGESLHQGIPTAEIHTHESLRQGILMAESPTEILLAIMTRIRMTLMRGTIRQPTAITHPLLDTIRRHTMDFLHQVWEESSSEVRLPGYHQYAPAEPARLSARLHLEGEKLVSSQEPHSREAWQRWGEASQGRSQNNPTIEPCFA